MPITPADAKVNLSVNTEASRLRENQRNQELGQGQLIAQNQEKEKEKLETIHNTEATEGKVIRQEDEDSERAKEQPDQSPKNPQAKKTEDQPVEEKSPPIPDPKGIRGMKIDFKA